MGMNSIILNEIPTDAVSNYSNECSLTGTDEEAVETVLSPTPEFSKDKLPFFRMKTACCGNISIHKGIENVKSLKENICLQSLFEPRDLFVVQNGRELLDDNILNPSVGPMYILVRSSSQTKVKLQFKLQGSKSESFLEFPMDARVFYVKKELFKRGITSIKPEMQRLISSTHIMKDNEHICDYLFPSCKVKISVPSNTTTNHKPISHIVHISKSFNHKQEVDIQLHFPNKTFPIFSISVCSPLSCIKEILHRQYGMSPFMPMSLRLKKRVLDQSKTLLDYGVTAERQTMMTTTKKSMVQIHALDCTDMQHAFLLLSICPTIADTDTDTDISNDELQQRQQQQQLCNGQSRPKRKKLHVVNSKTTTTSAATSVVTVPSTSTSREIVGQVIPTSSSNYTNTNTNTGLSVPGFSRAFLLNTTPPSTTSSTSSNSSSKNSSGGGNGSKAPSSSTSTSSSSSSSRGKSEEGDDSKSFFSSSGFKKGFLGNSGSGNGDKKSK
eukprot:gene10660-22251_t